MAAVHDDYLTKILTAQVYDVAIESPLELPPCCRCDVALPAPGDTCAAATGGLFADGVAVKYVGYRYAHPEEAVVFVGVEVQNRQECAALVATLRDHGLQAFDFSANEMAKLHIRHIVGGHAPHAAHELLYRFEFPERPGALLGFLDSLSHNWNISLFHYRNHGTDYGRVLIGIQVPPQDKAAFQDFLDRLGYVYCDESHNPAYRLFLS